MNTFKHIFALFIFFSLGAFVFVADSQGASIASATCSYVDVSTAVTSASVGDTINVPAGACTWSSTLIINKGISLIGAGVGNTIITSNASLLIDYEASNPATNALFRVSGFTFDFGAGLRNGISLYAGNTLVLQTKVRIDNNRFQNIAQNSTQVMYIKLGKVRGVIDHNYFTAATYFSRSNGDGNDYGVSLWNNWEGVVFGKVDNNMWFEDNIINVQNGGVIDCSQGSRYAFRYNTINTNGGGQMFDQHGNWGDGYSCFGGELYGNNIVATSRGQFLDQRGGRFFVFFNNFNTSGWNIDVREEADDAGNPVNYVGPNPPQYPQHVNGTYIWGNRANLTGALVSTGKGSNCVGTVCYSTPMPVGGQDFFTESTSPGIGCGLPASRPSSCTTNQGYWATNQSCTNLTGMVGLNPANPISGTLYRCTTANTWDTGASPLPYPHPLIEESTGSLTLTPPILKAPILIP